MRSNYSYTSCWRTQVSWPHSDDYNHTKLELILIFFNNFHPGWSSDKSSLRLYGTPLPSVEAEPIPLLCDPSHHPPVPHRDLWHNAVHLWTPGIHQSSDREGKIYRVHLNFLFYFCERCPSQPPQVATWAQFHKAFSRNCCLAIFFAKQNNSMATVATILTLWNFGWLPVYVKPDFAVLGKLFAYRLNEIDIHTCIPFW